MKRKLISVLWILLATGILCFVLYRPVYAAGAGDGKYDLPVYIANGDLSIYVRFIDPVGKTVWDNVSEALSASPTRANTVIEVAYNTYCEGYYIDIPATLPNGTYDMQVFPASTTTTKLTVVRIKWSRGALQKVPDNIPIQF
jgi:hypothetical protein